MWLVVAGCEQQPVPIELDTRPTATVSVAPAASVTAAAAPTSKALAPRPAPPQLPPATGRGFELRFGSKTIRLEKGFSRDVMEAQLRSVAPLDETKLGARVRYEEAEGKTSTVRLTFVEGKLSSAVMVGLVAKRLEDRLDAAGSRPDERDGMLAWIRGDWVLRRSARGPRMLQANLYDPKTIRAPDRQETVRVGSNAAATGASSRSPKAVPWQSKFPLRAGKRRITVHPSIQTSWLIAELTKAGCDAKLLPSRTARETIMVSAQCKTAGKPTMGFEFAFTSGRLFSIAVRLMGTPRQCISCQALRRWLAGEGVALTTGVHGAATGRRGPWEFTFVHTRKGRRGETTEVMIIFKPGDRSSEGQGTD